MGVFAKDVTRKTIADVNLANKQAYGEGGQAQTDFPEQYGYPASYPIAPADGLGPINSVAELQRRNAAMYGPSNSYESPTNMVGDEKEHSKDCAMHQGGSCDCSMGIGSDAELSTEPTGSMDGVLRSKEIEMKIAEAKRAGESSTKINALRREYANALAKEEYVNKLVRMPK